MTILNKKAPTFKLPSTDNDNFDLSKHVGKNIILYFYPRDNTSGCTIEAIDFNKLLPVIKKNNGIVIGVSKDSLESHMRFKSKNKLKFDLLSDENIKVLKKYKAWGLKKFLGKEYMGIIRTTILINAKGVTHKIWSNVRVKDHAKDVVEELKKINKT